MEITLQPTTLPNDYTLGQKEMAGLLNDIRLQYDTEAAMDALYQWSIGAGYIDIELLNANPKFFYPDQDTGITFRAQVNIARSLYTKQQFSTQPKNCCQLCFEQVASVQRPLLRALPLSLPNDQHYFMQLTPYPLAAKHWVIISTRHRPMSMDGHSLRDMLQILRLIPNYTILSNSDIAWAGASVLEHHHFQAIAELHLPIMDATATSSTQSKAKVTIDNLNYPIPSLRLRAKNAHDLATAADPIMQQWKNYSPGKSTWNLCLRFSGGEYELIAIARHADCRTPAYLHNIKKEGIGIIEVAGEGIFPLPTGNDAKEILQRIENNGLTIMKHIISAAAHYSSLHKDKDKVLAHMISQHAR